MRAVTHFIILICIISFACGQDKHAYRPWQIDTLFVITGDDHTFQLPEQHRPRVQSFQISSRGVILEEHLDFNYHTDKNAVLFYRTLQPGDTLQIRYTVFPILLNRSYRFFQFDTVSTVEGGEDSVKIIRPKFKNPFTGYTGDLKRSGSIIRGVNIGNNTDMSVNSGMNLQLAGNLTDDLEIVAALTDEATPIQPEGNTYALREVDQVYIQFKSPWAYGTLGDFNLSYKESYFGNLMRKLQGVSITGTYDMFDLGGTVATTRGFFNSLSFLGSEGNQGPYQLTGKDGEREIVVLAGTERVWINGEQLMRGEDNDYIIEYGNGQITFTNRRLVTSESRIEIDFEYYPALQKYSRNIYSAATTGNVGNDLFNYSVRYYQEKDDPTRLLQDEGIVSEEEKEIIKNAGNDPFAAYTSGIEETAPGQGYYNQADTVVNGESFTIYVYTGKDKGNYNVHFSAIGNRKGDYVRDGIGIYRWVGKGNGYYLPVILLPLPIHQDLLDVQTTYRPWKKFRITSEYATSYYDRNSLSTIGNENNRGQALQISSSVEDLSLSLGKIAFNATGRLVDQYFRSADRYIQPDYNRYWNILQDTEPSAQEKSLEAFSNYNPWEWLTVRINGGSLQKMDFRSLRYGGMADVSRKQWFEGSLAQEYIQSRYIDTKNNWLRQNGRLEKEIGYIKPGLFYAFERRKNFKFDETSGFEFNDVGGRMALVNRKFLNGFYQYNNRVDDIFNPQNNGEKIKQATTWTNKVRFDLQEWKRTQGSLEIVVRKKDYEPFFENTKIDSNILYYIDATVQDTSWRDTETNLAELVVNNYQWNRALDIQWQYRISTEQTALKEKIYLEVGEGRGNFRYDETLAEYVPDPDGNFVLYILPSGRFEPITGLNTSLNLRLEPDRYIKNPQSNGEVLLSKLSSETYIRIDEESKTDRLADIYFLNLSKFQKDKTVKGTFIFNEDLYILRQSRNLSFRLRYRYRDDLYNQFLDIKENEDRLTIERGLRTDYKIINALRSQSEIEQKSIFRNSKANTSRNRDIGSLALKQNFSYRPVQTWEFGLELEFGFEKDDANNKNLNLRYDRALARASYSLLRKGRLSADYELQSVHVLNNPLGVSIPFEMARGKKEGINHLWLLRGEYTVAENVVCSFTYRGRDETQFSKIIHSGQAEIRAYF
jgi:hypothetical protein